MSIMSRSHNWGCILPPTEVVLFTPPSPGFQPCHAVSPDLWHYPPRLGLPVAPVQLAAVIGSLLEFSTHTYDSTDHVALGFCVLCYLICVSYSVFITISHQNWERNRVKVNKVRQTVPYDHTGYAALADVWYLPELHAWEYSSGA